MSTKIMRKGLKDAGPNWYSVSGRRLGPLPQTRSMKYPTRRVILLSFLLISLVIFKFDGQPEVHAGGMGPSLVVHTLTGNIQLHKKFQSAFLPARDIIVYLPPDYEKEATRRYPVLYMQDGQIIFDIATSFFAGQERHMDERAQALIAKNEIRLLIIVGIYSGGLARKNEFTPPTVTQPGEADSYGRMLVEEIKPFVDSHYRTLTDRSWWIVDGRNGKPISRDQIREDLWAISDHLAGRVPR